MAENIVPTLALVSSRFDGPSTIGYRLARLEERALEEQSREARKKRIEVETLGIVRELVKLGCPRESTAAIAAFANTYRLGRNGTTFARALAAPGGIYIGLNLENRYFPYVFVSAIELVELMWRYPLRAQSLARKTLSHKDRRRVRSLAT